MLVLRSGSFQWRPCDAITAEIEFTNIEYLSTCELVFYYDPLRRYRFGAGLRGPGMFVIRQADGFSLKTLARSGDRQNLQARRRYKVEVSVFGSSVRLFVDSVEVLGCVLPQSLPPSQIGIKTVASTNVHIYGFDTDSKPGKVFVVMKFSSPYTEIYEEVIKTVCKGKFGLEVNNAAETYGPGQIMADIVHDIAESEFVIAEITPENPNVYYELGYADAIRKPVIMLANKKDLPKLPFDVSASRVLFYEDSIVGKRKFEEGLEKSIAAILEKSSLTLDKEHSVNLLKLPPSQP